MTQTKLSEISKIIIARYCGYEHVRIDARRRVEKTDQCNNWRGSGKQKMKRTK